MWRAARFTSSYADPLTDSESEENFEDGLDFQEQDESISGIRRRLSDEVEVSRVGQALNQTLEADRDERVAPRDHFSPVQVRFPVNAPALRPPTDQVTQVNIQGGEPEQVVQGLVVGGGETQVCADNMPPIVSFESEDGVDEAGAHKEACSCFRRFVKQLS